MINVLNVKDPELFANVVGEEVGKGEEKAVGNIVCSKEGTLDGAKEGWLEGLFVG